MEETEISAIIDRWSFKFYIGETIKKSSVQKL